MSDGRKHIAVFFGGTSDNRDLSIETGHWVCQHIPRSKYRITPVHVTADGLWQVPLGSLPLYGSVRGILTHMFDAIPAVSAASGLERLMRRPLDAIMTLMRGPGGDDGAMHGLSEMLDVPVVGSSMSVCHQTSNKQVCGERLADIISSPPMVRVDRMMAKSDDWRDELRDNFVPPFMVKPVEQEGSAGVQEVMSYDELGPATRRVLKHGEAMIQPKVTGQEVAVSLYEDERGVLRVLPPTVIIPRRGTFYDQMAKRRAGRADLMTSRAVRNDLLDEVEDIARDVYEELQCDGLVSMDFILGPEYTSLLDVNVIPTLTAFTPLARQLKAAHIAPSLLLTQLIERSMDL